MVKYFCDVCNKEIKGVNFIRVGDLTTRTDGETVEFAFKFPGRAYNDGHICSICAKRKVNEALDMYMKTNGIK